MPKNQIKVKINLLTGRRPMVIPFILLSVLLNSIAQLMLKEGMNRLGGLSLKGDQIWHTIWNVTTSGFIISGLTCYVASVIVWLIVLSRADVGYAYPITSLGYILTTLFGYLLLNEPLSMVRLTGVVVIIFGVYLVAQSHS